MKNNNNIGRARKYHRTDNELTKPLILDLPGITEQHSISNVNMRKQLSEKKKKKLWSSLFAPDYKAEDFPNG